MTLDENSAALALAAVPRRVTSSGYNARLAKSLKAGGDTTESAPDIRALTQAIKSGDAAAFARFYDLYSFRLYRFLLVLTRGNENAAREICQTALTKLAKRFEVFDDERKLWAWLCMLAKNSFIDHYRAQRRRDCLVSLEEMPGSIASAEHCTNQLSELLREALSVLRPDERELIQAAYIDRRPLQELASDAGVSYKAVEGRLARLRQRLKEQLLRELRHENES